MNKPQRDRAQSHQKGFVRVKTNDTPFLTTFLSPLCYKTLPFYVKIYNFLLLREFRTFKFTSSHHYLIHLSNTHCLMVSLYLYIYTYIYIYIYIYIYYIFMYLICMYVFVQMSLYMSFSHLCAKPSLPMLPSTPHTFPSFFD